MMRSERVPASPYAAPHTPIASAKRRRTSTGRSAGKATPKAVRSESENDSDVEVERRRKPSPGKTDLFSPHLNTDARPVTRSSRRILARLEAEHKEAMRMRRAEASVVSRSTTSSSSSSSSASSSAAATTRAHGRSRPMRGRHVEVPTHEEAEFVQKKLMDPNDRPPSPAHDQEPRTEEEDVEPEEEEEELQGEVSDDEAQLRAAPEVIDAVPTVAEVVSAVERKAGEEVEGEEEGEEEEEEEEFNPYSFMKQLPPHEQVKKPNKICLPPKKSTRNTPLTLVLDLDETLVHCAVEPIPNPDVEFDVNFNGLEYKVRARKRPYLDYFLAAVAKKFEVVVFTASQRVYADKLLNLIDPQHKLIRYRLFREACLLVQGNYLKDLTVLGRDLRKTVLVDNSPHAYGYQQDNGIPIESWFDDDNDTELLKLLEFLKQLENVEDVRPIVRQQFRTAELVASAPDAF